MARDGVSQRLPDERSGEHDAGDADARRQHRRAQWPALHLCGEHPWRRWRSRTYEMPQLPRDADRAIRLFHSAVSADARGLLPGLRDDDPGTVGCRVRWPDHIDAISSRNSAAADGSMRNVERCASYLACAIAVSTADLNSG